MVYVSGGPILYMHTSGFRDISRENEDNGVCGIYHPFDTFCIPLTRFAPFPREPLVFYYFTLGSR